jgi:hypothetical protein
MTSFLRGLALSSMADEARSNEGIKGSARTAAFDFKNVRRETGIVGTPILALQGSKLRVLEDEGGSVGTLRRFRRDRHGTYP